VERSVDWARNHPVAADALRALGLFLLSGIGRFEHPERMPLLVCFLLCAPLTLRRQAPRLVFAAVAGVALGQYLLDIRPTVADAAVLIALYTVVVHIPRRRDALAAAAVVLVGIDLAADQWSRRPSHVAVGMAVVVVAVVLIGEAMRARRAYLVELEERAARLERERDQRAEIAVAAERARIARELHDIVAHNVSVMVAQADGAQYAITTNPDRACQAMEVISRTGREALTEMRLLLDVLRPRETTGDTEPQPGIGDVGALIDRLRGAGLDVRLVVAGAGDALPAGVALAAYRVVQEALTNTMKHAGSDTRAWVWIDYSDDAIEIQVDDDGEAPIAANGAGHQPTPGHGLVGMRERAEMYGGFVKTGQRPEGGYRVHAKLPIGVP
jgi:signal transduction histidine kinase